MTASAETAAVLPLTTVTNVGSHAEDRAVQGQRGPAADTKGEGVSKGSMMGQDCVQRLLRYSEKGLRQDADPRPSHPRSSTLLS